jgi:hypothetical protein
MKVRKLLMSDDNKGSVYVPSSNVSAFPLAKPRYSNDNNNLKRDTQRDRLLTEGNISNIIRQLLDTQGFMISCIDVVETDAGTGTGEGSTAQKLLDVEFNLYGYNFRLHNWQIPNFLGTGSSFTIYAKLSDIVNDEINGQDNNDGVYEGLVMCDRLVEGDIGFALLEISGCTVTADGVITSFTHSVPNESYIKFNGSSLKIGGIDGKYKK